jgi:hypothetical protein
MAATAANVAMAIAGLRVSENCIAVMDWQRVEGDR